MKRYTSMLTLLSGATLYRLVLVLAGTALAHAGVFLWRWDQRPEQNYDHLLHWGIFTAGLALVTLVLTANLSPGPGGTAYTLDRLRVGRWGIYAVQSCFNAVCCLLFWFTETLVAFGLCWLWANRVEPGSPQTVLLAFYRSNLLHSLLPLADISRYISNLFLFCGLGATTACATWLSRGKSRWYGGLACALSLGFQQMGTMTKDLLWGFMGVLIPFITIIMTFGGEFQNEED